MRTKIKKTNLKRLASLSALGAGALGMTAGTADASSIVYSGILDEPIVGSGGVYIHGPHGPGGLFTFNKLCSSEIGGCEESIVLVGDPPYGKHGTLLGDLNGARGFLAAFPAGAEWGNRKTSGVGGLLVTSRIFSSETRRSSFSNYSATDKYLLFRFMGGDFKHDVYGWAQLDVTVCAPLCLAATLVDYAYDTSGAQLPAGDTGQTPEPCTFALTGLAALALGAKGTAGLARSAKSGERCRTTG